MARINDAVAAADAKVSVLLTKVSETVTTLGELKVLIGDGNPANTDDAVAALAAIGAKVDEALGNLSTAETDADPTPDAPIE